MNVTIVTPAGRGSRLGNRVTALRWAGLIRQIGHRVRVVTEADDEALAADALFALHAHRSAASAKRFADRGEGRLVVALTGTDLYRDLPASAPARESLRRAEALVVLHPLAVDRLARMDRAWAAKAQLVLQSVPPIPAEAPTTGAFEVCVVGHLRDEKDPLRVAEAARRLPDESRLRVVQAGRALTEGWRERAIAEQASNPRYRWLGEVSRRRAHRLIARARLMVLPSRMEGGANVIGEALVAGTPVIASRIEGSVGLLGADYPGFFEVEDTAGLAGMLHRAEREPAFLERLAHACRALAPCFSPDAERAALSRLVER